MTQVPYLDADEIFSLLSPIQAVNAIEAALRTGLEPSNDFPRSVVPLRNGQFLLMPADLPGAAGVKVATVAPENAALALPRIQGIYVLFDGTTLAPRGIFDGIALTNIRTAAVSVAAVRPFLGRKGRRLKVVVFGTGPQALAHVRTLQVLGESVVDQVTHVVRTPRVIHPYPGADLDVCLSGTLEADNALRAADVVVCATSAATPLFDSSLLGPDAVVIAVGSHEPDVREVDADFLASATVVVEDSETALRECGDVVMAIDEGKLDPAKLVPMASVIRGDVQPPGGRVLFKSSGMSWEDLVIACAVADRYAAASREIVNV